MDFSVELSRFVVVAGETLHTVWDIQSAISRALEGTEDPCPCSGACEPHIQVASERAGLSVLTLYVVLITINLVIAGVDLVQFQALQQTARQQEARAVRSRVIGQPDLDTVSRELMSVSSANDGISLDFGVRYLANNVLVCEPDDHAVLGGIVLVLVLNA